MKKKIVLVHCLKPNSVTRLSGVWTLAGIQNRAVQILHSIANGQYLHKLPSWPWLYVMKIGTATLLYASAQLEEYIKV